MMKKLISLLLAAILLMACSVSLADNSSTLTTQIGNMEKKFNVSFQLPEGAQVLYEGWTEGSLYQANIELKPGEFLYMSVDGTEATEDGSGLTYSEAKGYTDEKMLALIDTLYADGEYEDFEKRVVTTTYGTKIALIRVNDEEEPMAYAWSMWNGFEIGLTLTNVTDDGEFQPITDAQVDNMVAFCSEVWMHMNVTEVPADADGKQETAPAATEAPAEASPEKKELDAVSAWLSTQLPKGSEEEVLNWDLDTIKALLDKYEGELKYFTKEQLAETLYKQLTTVKDFVESVKTLVENDPTMLVEP